MKTVIVIGGGASGFFAAINCAIKNPNYSISILEKTTKLLSKVKVSGGGRCNVTHNCFENSELVKNYPRGNKELQQVFSKFNVQDTISWFKKQGIEINVEEDGRIFPASNSSQTIIDCFLNLATQFKIKIITNCEVFAIKKTENQFQLKTNSLQLNADVVICSIGGHNKEGHYQFLKNLGHTISPLIPSLFTVNLPNDIIKKDLQGISVQTTEVKIENTKINYTGPVLITHWGLSGPAVLKLSAFAAQHFFNLNYTTKIIVNWVYPLILNNVEEELKTIQEQKHKALPTSQTQFNLPKRLWEFLCQKSEITNQKPWAELSKKQLKLLAQNLCNSSYEMQGKTTFKEEFVTCGGIQLKEIDFKTMQSKFISNLFFCGEVLNIDGITGGFNFQNAWSTAWICSQNI